MARSGGRWLPAPEAPPDQTLTQDNGAKWPRFSWQLGLQGSLFFTAGYELAFQA